MDSEDGREVVWRGWGGWIGKVRIDETYVYIIYFVFMIKINNL